MAYIDEMMKKFDIKDEHINSVIELYEKIENRNNRYIECIKSALNNIEIINSITNNVNLIIKPIIVENNGMLHSHTFLNEISPNIDVIYTSNNKHDYSHKGSNEIMDIKEVIEKCNIQDDDIVIKITGRYKLLSNYFLQQILDNYNNYDDYNII